MSGFAHAVRQRIEDPDCLVDGMKKGGCGVSLTAAPRPHVVIDLDEAGSPLGPARTKCDFLFFADPSLVMALEMKDGDPNVTKATRQLQAGADAADALAARDRDVIFRPVLVSRGLRSKKRNDLREATVRFRKRSSAVRRLDCGDLLTHALPGS